MFTYLTCLYMLSTIIWRCFCILFLGGYLFCLHIAFVVIMWYNVSSLVDSRQKDYKFNYEKEKTINRISMYRSY